MGLDDNTKSFVMIGFAAVVFLVYSLSLIAIIFNHTKKDFTDVN
jgi:heme exporter protein D